MTASASNAAVNGAPARIGIVGAGLMGRGIAQVALLAGHAVHMVEADAAAADACTTRIAAELDKLVARGRLSAGRMAEALAALQVSRELSTVAPCALVIEAVIESLALKRDIFRRLEAIVSPDCILASNTSSLLIVDIAAACERPGRVAGLHFFSPVPRMRLAEVVAAPRTAPQVVERLRAFTVGLGHVPVIAKDTPGFIVNHAGRAFGPESLRLLGEGVAPPAAIDTVLREACGFRMGPFELFDLTGLDVSHPAGENIYRQYFDEPRFRPSLITRQRQAAGLLGRKSSAGFYDYAADGVQPWSPPAVAPVPVTAWFGDGPAALVDVLRAAILNAGGQVDHGERPGADATCLVFPVGEDATTAAHRGGLDARRVVAVDPLFHDPLVTLMATPVTEPARVDGLVAALVAAGRRVVPIQDSPGFVAQRVVACIVNIACDMAQQGVAEPPAIDEAVRLGLGYPMGPFAWGDRLGADVVLRIMEGLNACFADPRYRPSPWLRRRAMLKLPLGTMPARPCG